MLPPSVVLAFGIRGGEEAKRMDECDPRKLRGPVDEAWSGELSQKYYVVGSLSGALARFWPGNAAAKTIGSQALFRPASGSQRVEVIKVQMD
jgi:hypothetical protein